MQTDILDMQLSVKHPGAEKRTDSKFLEITLHPWLSIWPVHRMEYFSRMWVTFLHANIEILLLVENVKASGSSLHRSMKLWEYFRPSSTSMCWHMYSRQITQTAADTCNATRKTKLKTRKIRRYQCFEQLMNLTNASMGYRCKINLKAYQTHWLWCRLMATILVHGLGFMNLCNLATSKL